MAVIAIVTILMISFSEDKTTLISTYITLTKARFVELSKLQHRLLKSEDELMK